MKSSRMEERMISCAMYCAQNCGEIFYHPEEIPQLSTVNCQLKNITTAITYPVI